MAHNPTDPGADGAAHLAVLTDYAEWSYDAADNPLAPPAETTADATVATVASKTVASVVEALDAPALDAFGAPSVEASDPPPGAGSPWARWVLNGLRAELQRQKKDPRASPKRQKALDEAILHLDVWK